MPKNFIPCDRDQQMLLPPDMKEWLPPDHLVWFVIDSVAQLDLSGFYAHHRDDGWGRAAYDPRMMVTLLLYAYAKGIRSAREIERRLLEDVAFRIITAERRVDHATICRFRTRRRDELEDLFVGVLGLCVEAGMVHPAVVAIDGTKLQANASAAKNLTREQLEEFARRVFDEAEAIDAEEDELYGDGRGDEIPEHLVDEVARVEWIRHRLEEREREVEERAKSRATPRVNTTDPDSALQKTSQGFIQGYNAQLAVTEDQIIVAADLTSDNNDFDQLEPMITQAADNLEAVGADALESVVADAGYFSEQSVDLDLGIDLLVAPVATRNLEQAVADRPPPDAVTRRRRERLQRERAAAQRHAARREDVIAAYVAKQVTRAEAAEALATTPERISWLAWHLKKFGSLPNAQLRVSSPSAREVMLERFSEPGAIQTYAIRARTVEPVIGQIKEARQMRRFMHRGHSACRCEWRMMNAATNLRKWARLTEAFSRLSPGLRSRRPILVQGL